MLPNGWAENVRIAVNGNGCIDHVATGQAPDGAVRLKGP
ncbi:MAG: hypothetical protein ACE5EM_10570, partial [Sphingomonadales bacterium]